MWYSVSGSKSALILGEFLGSAHIWREWTNRGPHRVAPFVWLLALRDNKRACRSQLHLSKHLTRAIHKQSFALTHFLPRNAFSFYPLGLRGTAGFACRVPLFVSGTHAFCRNVQLREDTRQYCKNVLFVKLYHNTLAIKTKCVSSFKEFLCSNRCGMEIPLLEATKKLLRQVPKIKRIHDETFSNNSFGLVQGTRHRA